MPLPDPSPQTAALVTGASSGIGAAFARSLAERGHDLIVVARRQERLDALARELGARHGVSVRPVLADLTADVGLERCRRAADEADDLDTAVLNAGFGSKGPAWELDREVEVQMVRLNCVAVTDLAFHLVPSMVARGRGDLVVVSSASANTPLPFMATYAATKAFEAHLVDALAAELAGTGVRATVVLPGPTRTEFRVAGDSSGPPRGIRKDDPEDVVRAAWEALDRGRPRASVGRLARLGAVGSRVLPRRVVTRLVARWGRPRR